MGRAESRLAPRALCSCSSTFSVSASRSWRRNSLSDARSAPPDGLSPGWECALFLLTLPAWIVGAKLYELYDLDEERADHTTVDDFVGSSTW